MRQAFREDLYLVHPIPPILADAIPEDSTTQYSMQILQMQFAQGLGGDGTLEGREEPENADVARGPLVQCPSVGTMEWFRHPVVLTIVRLGIQLRASQGKLAELRIAENLRSSQSMRPMSPTGAMSTLSNKSPTFSKRADVRRFMTRTAARVAPASVPSQHGAVAPLLQSPDRLVSRRLAALEHDATPSAVQSDIRGATS